jgi:hypothetical protein
MDLLVGPCADDVARRVIPPVRDRDGNWTYLLCVVVDDVRQDIDLVVRGRTCSHRRRRQIRLARLLGREAPPAFGITDIVRDSEGRKALEVLGRNRRPRAPGGRSSRRRGGRDGRRRHRLSRAIRTSAADALNVGAIGPRPHR